MFKALTRQLQSGYKLQLALFGASVGVLASTQNQTLSDSPAPKRRSYQYLICGGGVAAQSALETLLENNASDLLLVTPEWRSKTPPTPPKSALSSLTSFFATSPEILIGPTVESVDTASRTATLDDGTLISFQRCLLAVGADIPDIPIGKVISHDAAALVSGIQSRENWQRIERLIRDNYIPGVHRDTRAHVTIVGGGWMAPIVGAELIHKGADVTFSFAEPSFLSRYFPRYVAQDIYTRLTYLSDGGVDTLSYAAIRYIVARKSPIGGVEAEVHVGTVFDAFSIIDFRTDHVVFAPTLPTTVPVNVPNVVKGQGFTANQELSIASDIYVAGAALAVDNGGVDYAKGMRWSADHARVTGRHAAMNMLGKRDAYQHTPCLTVDLGTLNLRVSVVGDLDGSKESFGYFQRGKERGDDTCGGVLERGVLFCVQSAPPSHRGAPQKLLIKGIAIWDGSREKGIQGTQDIVEIAKTLVRKEAMTRKELEIVMDAFAEEQLDIRLYQNGNGKGDPPRPDRTAEGDRDATGEDENGTDVNNGDGVWLRPLAETRKPAPGIMWRRHRSARGVRIREDEVLWVENEWVGAISPNTKVDKTAQAYSDLLRRAAGKET